MHEMKCLDNMEDKNVVILLLQCKINTLCINVKQEKVLNQIQDLNNFRSNISCVEFLFFIVEKNIFNASNLENLEIGNSCFSYYLANLIVRK